MLVNLKTVLDMAEKGGFCIPAFNVYNMESAMGVVKAAEEMKAPIIMQVYPRLMKEETGYYLSPVILAAAKRASVPVCFHLDHGPSELETTRSLRYGATGIMLDGSTLPFEENNCKGEPTVMVVPYGPIGPYARMAELVNKYRISLKNCVFMNMDEYLDENGKYIDYNHPLSFRGGMDRTFYSKVDDELNVLPENRIFPDPENPGKIMEIIEKYGKLDMVFGGVGINGHYAFNEPPEAWEKVTPEEFAQRPTRVLKIARETRTINAFMNCGANIEAIPENCITVGMKEIFKAKKIRMCMPRDWNAAALRKVLHGPVSAYVPCSLFQNHPDALLYAAAVATQCPVSEIRVYSK